MIAVTNRNCFPKPNVRALCLQLLYLRFTLSAPCSFCQGLALDTLNCGTNLASHSTIPKPLRHLAPPSDPFGIYEVWGSIVSLPAPPLDPFGMSGYGAFGGRTKSRLNLSSRNVRLAQRKRQNKISRTDPEQRRTRVTVRFAPLSSFGATFCDTAGGE